MHEEFQEAAGIRRPRRKAVEEQEIRAIDLREESRGRATNRAMGRNQLEEEELKEWEMGEMRRRGRKKSRSKDNKQSL